MAVVQPTQVDLPPVRVPDELTESFDGVRDCTIYFMDYVLVAPTSVADGDDAAAAAHAGPSRSGSNKSNKPPRGVKKVVFATPSELFLCEVNGTLERRILWRTVTAVRHGGKGNHVGLHIPIEDSGDPSYDLLVRTGNLDYFVHVVTTLVGVARDLAGYSEATFTGYGQDAVFPTDELHVVPPAGWAGNTARGLDLVPYEQHPRQPPAAMRPPPPRTGGDSIMDLDPDYPGGLPAAATAPAGGTPTPAAHGCVDRPGGGVGGVPPRRRHGDSILDLDPNEAMLNQTLPPPTQPPPPPGPPPLRVRKKHTSPPRRRDDGGSAPVSPRSGMGGGANRSRTRTLSGAATKARQLLRNAADAGRRVGDRLMYTAPQSPRTASRSRSRERERRGQRERDRQRRGRDSPNNLSLTVGVVPRSPAGSSDVSRFDESNRSPSPRDVVPHDPRIDLIITKLEGLQDQVTAIQQQRARAHDVSKRGADAALKNPASKPRRRPTPVSTSPPPSPAPLGDSARPHAPPPSQQLTHLDAPTGLTPPETPMRPPPNSQNRHHTAPQVELVGSSTAVHVPRSVTAVAGPARAPGTLSPTKQRMMDDFLSAVGAGGLSAPAKDRGVYPSAYPAAQVPNFSSPTGYTAPLGIAAADPVEARFWRDLGVTAAGVPLPRQGYAPPPHADPTAYGHAAQQPQPQYPSGDVGGGPTVNGAPASLAGPRTCWYCNVKLDALGAIPHCSRCGKATYCDAVCQGRHWKVHKAVCKAQPAGQGHGVVQTPREEMEIPPPRSADGYRPQRAESEPVFIWDTDAAVRAMKESLDRLPYPAAAGSSAPPSRGVPAPNPHAPMSGTTATPPSFAQSMAPRESYAAPHDNPHHHRHHHPTPLSIVRDPAPAPGAGAGFPTDYAQEPVGIDLPLPGSAVPTPTRRTLTGVGMTPQATGVVSTPPPRPPPPPPPPPPPAQVQVQRVPSVSMAAPPTVPPRPEYASPEPGAEAKSTERRRKPLPPPPSYPPPPLSPMQHHHGATPPPPPPRRLDTLPGPPRDNGGVRVDNLTNPSRNSTPRGSGDTAQPKLAAKADDPYDTLFNHYKEYYAGLLTRDRSPNSPRGSPE